MLMHHVFMPFMTLCILSIVLCTCTAFYLQNTELDFYIDVHAHSTLSNGNKMNCKLSLCKFHNLIVISSLVVFIVGNLYSGDRFDQHMVLPKLLSNKLKNFSWVGVY